MVASWHGGVTTKIVTHNINGAVSLYLVTYSYRYVRLKRSECDTIILSEESKLSCPADARAPTHATPTGRARACPAAARRQQPAGDVLGCLCHCSALLRSYVEAEYVKVIKTSHQVLAFWFLTNIGFSPQISYCYKYS
jgi:hypothetical protein